MKDQPPARGFPGLRCPLCGSDDTQTLDLDDLATCRCSGCGEEYTLDDVQKFIDSWRPVLAWVAQAPPAE